MPGGAYLSHSMPQPIVPTFEIPDYTSLPLVQGMYRVQVRIRDVKGAYFSVDGPLMRGIPNLGQRVRYADGFGIVDQVDWYPTGTAFFIDVQTVVGELFDEPLTVPDYTKLGPIRRGMTRMQVRPMASQGNYLSCEDEGGVQIPELGQRVRFADKLGRVNQIDWYPLAEQKAIFIDVQCVDAG